MDRYNVYNAVQVVKNWFRAPLADQPSADSGDDAQLIRDISRCEIVCASNRHQYFYCMPYDAENKDVLEYMLRRNGVAVIPYYSLYNSVGGGRNLVLRVRKRALAPLVREYVTALVRGTGAPRQSDAADIDRRIAIVRAQMGKSK